VLNLSYRFESIAVFFFLNIFYLFIRFQISKAICEPCSENFALIIFRYILLSHFIVIVILRIYIARHYNYYDYLCNIGFYIIIRTMII